MIMKLKNMRPGPQGASGEKNEYSSFVNDGKFLGQLSDNPVAT
jgi:hypothetical protein